MIPSLLLLIDYLEPLKINDYKLGFLRLVSLEFINKRKVTLLANLLDELLIPAKFKGLNERGDGLSGIKLSDKFVLCEWNLESHVI